LRPRTRRAALVWYVRNDQLTPSLLAGGAAVAIWLYSRINVWQWCAVVVATALAVLYAIVALRRSQTARGRAFRVFAAVVLWSGAIGFLYLNGERHPTLDVAFVLRRAAHGQQSREAVGFFVARTDGDLYLSEKLK